jgi:alpha-ketoglutarate-dependent taurine dioxygenase
MVSVAHPLAVPSRAGPNAPPLVDVDASRTSAEGLLTHLVALDQGHPPLFARFRADFEVDAFLAAVNGSRQFDLVESSDGAVSFVRHGPDPSDRSARMERFDFHTDGLYLDDPPDYCALYCLDHGRADMPTVFIDARHALEKLLASGVSLQALSGLRQVYWDRRGVRHEYPIIRRHPRFGFWVLQYFAGDGRFGGLESSVGAHGNAKKLRDITMAVDRCIRECDPIFIHWSRGSFVVWDNYVMLHARFFAGVDLQRQLARFWLRRRASEPIY